MQLHYRFSLRAISICLLILVLAAPMLSALAQTGTVLVDTGFRPQQHGFSFANYGNENKPVNLTPDSMRQLLGDGVCKAIQNSQCVLTATAQAWMDKQNTGMNGGHCEGMAALSKLIFTGQVKLQDLDPNAKTVADLKADNPRVQAEIAKWFATQYTPPTATSEIKDKTPTQLVDTLIEQLKPGSGPFTMGIYKDGYKDGHAISPYAVVDMGNGVVRVMVYDNNYPGEERFIEIDRNANTWKYTGSTNPNEPAAEYAGTATSLTLTLTPTQVRTQIPQVCEFCKPAGDAVAQGTETPEDPARPRGSCGYTYINTGDNTDVVVTNSDGQTAGFVKGHVFSNIPGADILRPRSALNDDTPGAVIVVPNTGGEMSMTFSTEGSPSDVMVYTCGSFQRVRGMSQADGEADTLTFDPAVTHITGEVDPDEHVSFLGGYDDPDGDDFTYFLPDVSSADGSTIVVGADPTSGAFTFESSADLLVNVDFSSITLEGELLSRSYEGLSSTPSGGFVFDFSEVVITEEVAPEVIAPEPGSFEEFETSSTQGEESLNQAEDEASSEEDSSGE